MQIKKFGLGVRFDMLETTADESTEKMLFEEIFSVLTVNDVKGLKIYGGVSEADIGAGRNIYHVVFSGGGFKETKRIFTKLDNDAGIGMYLTHTHPFIETNRLLYVDGLTYFGTVKRDGQLAGGERGFFSLVIPKKHGKRRSVGKGMSIVMALAPYSYALTASEAIRRLTIAARRHFPGTKIVPLPLIAGKTGTLEAMVTTTGGETRSVVIKDVLGGKINANFGVLYGTTAIIELTIPYRDGHIPKGERDILAYSSYGAGELIKRALDEGLMEILISGGALRVFDGGMGSLVALGAKFLDDLGNEIAPCAKNLERIKKIDLSNLNKRVNEARFIVMTDDETVLTGKNGVVYNNADKHRLSPADMFSLERGMKNYERRLFELLDIDLSDTPHMGALNGFAAMAKTVLSAEIKPCAETFLESVDFRSMLKTAALVVTGGAESELPFIKTLLSLCEKRMCPTAAILGSNIADSVASGVMPLFDNSNFDVAADKLFSLIRIGRDVNRMPLPKKLVRRL
ncbi:MAG: glycerate kinase [Clostridia bacterium]